MVEASVEKILLGEKWDPRTGRMGGAFYFNLDSHLWLIAPNGAGKGVCLEIPNLLIGLRNMSVLSLDPSGQNAAITAAARSAMGQETLMLNPFNLHVKRYRDMADLGFNPLMLLNSNSPSFELDAMGLADILISVEGDSNRFFPEAARGLMTWLMMFVRLKDGHSANLGTVRDILTGDLEGAAKEAVATGHPRLMSLAAKYTDMEGSKSQRDVVLTAEAQTRWLLDPQMRDSLSKHGIGDFARLKERLSTLFVILPAGTELETHGVWFKLVVTCALNALYRRGAEEGEDGIPVLLLLSEFAQMGKLPPIRAAVAQVRKYGIRLWPVLQDYGQAVSIYGPNETKSFIANSWCTIGMAPNDDMTASWMAGFSGKETVMSVSARDNPKGGGPDINVGTVEELVWTADHIRELPQWHALVWNYRTSRPQPVYLAPYWEIRQCRRVARPDPYHSSSRKRGRFMRTAVVAAAAVALAAAVHGGVSLQSLLSLFTG
jgi:type IV secretion system protein VirD4